MSAKVCVILLVAALLLASSTGVAQRLEGLASAEAFAAAVRSGETRPANARVEFSLSPLSLQKQVFHKVRRQPIWHHFLYMERAAFAERTGELCIDATLYRLVSQDKSWSVSAPFAFKTDAAAARRICAAADLLALDIRAAGTVKSFRAEGPEPDSRRVEFADLTVDVLVDGKSVYKGPARSIPIRDVPGPDAPIRAGATRIAERTVLEMEAEDASGLIYYADWERDETGWYGREITRDVSGTGMAVVHARNIGAVLTHRLVRPLPPGRYRVDVAPCYAGARLREFIVDADLAGARGRVAWFLAERGGEWMKGRSFVTGAPATELRIIAVQSGGGGINAAPEMRDMVIMLDRIRIVAVSEGAEEVLP